MKETLSEPELADPLELPLLLPLGELLDGSTLGSTLLGSTLLLGGTTLLEGSELLPL